jgi:hypothetical protein
MDVIAVIVLSIVNDSKVPLQVDWRLVMGAASISGFRAPTARVVLQLPTLALLETIGPTLLRIMIEKPCKNISSMN